MSMSLICIQMNQNRNPDQETIHKANFNVVYLEFVSKDKNTTKFYFKIEIVYI